MAVCCVKDCNVSRNDNTDKYTFHRFPTDPEMASTWAKLIGRDGWTPSEWSVVCSRHFEEKCIVQRPKQRRLVKGSTLTLFVPMTDYEVATSSPTELLSTGRRNLAVRDFSAATEALASACELLAKEHGETGDQCAEAYLWYGKALLGLSREENGVLGDGVPGTGNADEEGDEDEDQEEGAENEEADENSEAEAEHAAKTNGVAEDKEEKVEPESTTKDEPTSSSSKPDDQPGPSNGKGDVDESVVDLDNDDDVDNLQLAWEMLDLARSILRRRVEQNGGDAARALLADVHLALGEVALESETYDKAVIDMQSCLEIQKELYCSDDRRIAETHYQIGLANSLASNFEEAITHFKNAANILETRIKTLENPTTVSDDATVKKYTSADPFYTVAGEIKELKELLPEIHEKIQDMMDYKAETMKRIRESLMGSNGQSSSSSNANGAIGSSSSSAPKPAATNISHLIKRKRKSSEAEAEGSAPKRANT